MGSAKRGSSPGRRCPSSSAANEGVAERRPGDSGRLRARRDADELHRRQSGAGHRPARARLEEPGCHQRLPHSRLEVRDSSCPGRHRQRGRAGAPVFAPSLACGGSRGGRGTRTHVLALRELQRRQGRGDGRRHVPRSRTPRRADCDGGVGHLSLADRLRVAQLDYRGPERPALGGPPAAGLALCLLGERRARGAHHLRPSAEHLPAAERDREPISDARQTSVKVAVIGGGAWGTALADLLARKGEQVTLWAREAEVVDGVNREHRNEMFLPGASLAPALRAEGDIATAVRGVETVVSVAPSHAVRPVMAEAARSLDRSQPLVVSASKGLDPDRLERPSCILADVLPQGVPVVVLSGPSFAWEVFQQQPTAVVAAATDHSVAQRAQRVFSTAYFRVYSHTDVVGVELAGALKNVIALAAGILEGLGLGFNTRAALITRGLAEMTRLGVKLGAQPITFAGLAGKPAVVEGVNTTRTAVALGERHGVELPIAREVANVLFKNKPPRQAISDLMERELKAETR